MYHDGTINIDIGTGCCFWGGDVRDQNNQTLSYELAKTSCFWRGLLNPNSSEDVIWVLVLNSCRVWPIRPPHKLIRFRRLFGPTSFSCFYLFDQTKACWFFLARLAPCFYRLLGPTSPSSLLLNLTSSEGVIIVFRYKVWMCFIHGTMIHACSSSRTSSLLKNKTLGWGVELNKGGASERNHRIISWAIKRWGCSKNFPTS